MSDLDDRLKKLRQQHIASIIEFGCTCDDLICAKDAFEALKKTQKLQRDNMHKLGGLVRDLAAKVTSCNSLAEESRDQA